MFARNRAADVTDFVWRTEQLRVQVRALVFLLLDDAGTSFAGPGRTTATTLSELGPVEIGEEVVVSVGDQFRESVHAQWSRVEEVLGRFWWTLPEWVSRPLGHFWSTPPEWVSRPAWRPTVDVVVFVRRVRSVDVGVGLWGAVLGSWSCVRWRRWWR